MTARMPRSLRKPSSPMLASNNASNPKKLDPVRTSRNEGTPCRRASQACEGAKLTLARASIFLFLVEREFEQGLKNVL